MTIISNEDLLARLERIEAENTELRAEMAKLRRSGREANPQAPERTDDPVSRRGLLRKLGTAAAAGGALAVGGSVLGASPAAAAAGDPVVLGEVNDAGTEITGIRSVVQGGYPFAVSNDFSSEGSGAGSGGISAYGVDYGVLARSALTGVYGQGRSLNGRGVVGVTGDFAGQGTTGTGVHGIAEPNLSGFPPEPHAPAPQSIGVRGENKGLGVGVAGDSISGIGVRAAGGQSPLLLVPAGTAGPPASGEREKGEIVLDSDGVLWICTSGGARGTTWVRNITSGTNANGAAPTTIESSVQTLLVRSTGSTDNAMQARIDNSSSAQAALYANTTGTGSAIYGRITRSTSPANAVRAFTDGTGAALFARCTADSNTSQAIWGIAGPNGRGAQLEGGKAQLRLVPGAGAHPASGAAGDLFLDSAKDLWLCKGGSTWVKVG